MLGPQDEGWICNSSFCMQKRGLPCTGIAIHEAKKLGFASVGHQIQVRGGNSVDGAPASVARRYARAGAAARGVCVYVSTSARA